MPIYYYVKIKTIVLFKINKIVNKVSLAGDKFTP